MPLQKGWADTPAQIHLLCVANNWTATDIQSAVSARRWKRGTRRRFVRLWQSHLRQTASWRGPISPGHHQPSDDDKFHAFVTRAACQEQLETCGEGGRRTEDEDEDAPSDSLSGSVNAWRPFTVYSHTGSNTDTHTDHFFKATFVFLL